MPAVAAVLTVAVVPYVPAPDSAWCPDVSFGPASAPALLAACVAPLFNSATWVSDRVAQLALVLMVVYCFQAACYGVGAVLCGVVAVGLLNHISPHDAK